MAINNTYYFRSTGGNWNQASSWSTVDSTSATNSTGAYPTASDAAILDGNSNSTCTIDPTTLAACSILDCSAYTGNLYFKADLDVFNSINLGSGMVVTTDNTEHELKIRNCDITTNGVDIPLTVNFPGTGASPYSRSLADSMNCLNLKVGNYIFVSESLTNSVYINVGGDLTVTYNTYTISGSYTVPVIFKMTGSGIFESLNSGYPFVAPLEIDTAGTITFGSTITNRIGTLIDSPELPFNFKYTAGTVDTTDTDFLFLGYPNSCKIDSNGMSFDNTTQFSGLIELYSPLTANTTFFAKNSSYNITMSGSYGFTCNDMILTGNTGNAGNITLEAGVTYTVDRLLHRSIMSSSAQNIASSDSVNKAILTLNGISALNNCSLQRIDASNGFHINTNGRWSAGYQTEDNSNVGISSQNILG